MGKHDRLTISLWTRVDSLKEPWSALLNTAGWAAGGLHLQYLESGNLELALHGPKELASLPH